MTDIVRRLAERAVGLPPPAPAVPVLRPRFAQQIEADLVEELHEIVIRTTELREERTVAASAEVVAAPSVSPPVDARSAHPVPDASTAPVAAPRLPEPPASPVRATATEPSRPVPPPPPPLAPPYPEPTPVEVRQPRLPPADRVVDLPPRPSARPAPLWQAPAEGPTVRPAPPSNSRPPPVPARPVVPAMPVATRPSPPPKLATTKSTTPASEQPPVRISIGRVDVRASLAQVPSPLASAPARAQHREPALSLADYLAGRRDER